MSKSHSDDVIANILSFTSSNVGNLIRTPKLKDLVLKSSYFDLSKVKQYLFTTRELKMMLLNPNLNKKDILTKAKDADNSEVIISMLKRKLIDLDEELLIWASQNNHYNLVKLILARGKLKTYEAIYRASQRGYHNIVKLLLSRSNLDSLKIPIELASQNCHYKVVELLLDHSGSDIDLMEAFRLSKVSGCYRSFNLLLTRIKNSLTQYQWYLSLLSASKSGYFQMVKPLVAMNYFVDNLTSGDVRKVVMETVEFYGRKVKHKFKVPPPRYERKRQATTNNPIWKAEVLKMLMNIPSNKLDWYELLLEIESYNYDSFDVYSVTKTLLDDPEVKNKIDYFELMNYTIKRGSKTLRNFLLYKYDIKLETRLRWHILYTYDPDYVIKIIKEKYQKKKLPLGLIDLLFDYNRLRIIFNLRGSYIDPDYIDEYIDQSHPELAALLDQKDCIKLNKLKELNEYIECVQVGELGLSDESYQ